MIVRSARPSSSRERRLAALTEDATVLSSGPFRKRKRELLDTRRRASTESSSSRRPAPKRRAPSKPCSPKAHGDTPEPRESSSVCGYTGPVFSVSFPGHRSRSVPASTTACEHEHPARAHRRRAGSIHSASASTENGASTHALAQHLDHDRDDDSTNTRNLGKCAGPEPRKPSLKKLGKYWIRDRCRALAARRAAAASSGSDRA